MSNATTLFPLFLKLDGRKVVLVGGGKVASGKLPALLEAGAQVTVVAPSILPELHREGVAILRRPFIPGDLDGAFLVIAAATPDVNRAVREAGDARGVFVNAVDDPDKATAYTGGVVRKAGVTFAISTDGGAPALTGLLREGLEAVLPEELDGWLDLARALRVEHKSQEVPFSKRRGLLLDALVRKYGAKRPESSGFVSLVGAGPGDPELLTLKAVRLLESADLVLYDALVAPEVLAIARDAQCFFVGKRGPRKAAAGSPRTIKQQTINQLLIRAARRGKRVVRLKCGDPFVLGRGGEEALALAEAGIPFEVVPGVSSAVAAPALSGIPVTHRGLSSAFMVVSGHAESAYRPALESVEPGSMTLVVLMGMAQRGRISELLRERGWPKETPAAIHLAASTARAQTWLGTLESLAGAELPDGSDAPGTICIGAVVRLARVSEGTPNARHG